MRIMLTSILVSFALNTVGCAHNQKKDDTIPSSGPAIQTQTPAQATPAAGAQGGEQTCTSDIQCGAKQLCIRSHCVDITPDLAECSTVRIHFDFNATGVHEQEKPSLDRMARCLKADLALHVTIEGNADERGTQDYNLSLGDKRATEIARYLEALGVSPAQLKTVSFGKENPLCTEHDEECWSKNRRAALKPKEGRH